MGASYWMQADEHLEARLLARRGKLAAMSLGGGEQVGDIYPNGLARGSASTRS